MLKLKKIAVTGGIASGKSTICEFLKECGATLISADHIVHNLLSPNTHLGKKIISLLGKGVIENDRFNRKAIARAVFENYKLLYQLEELIHPEVQKEIDKAYCALKKQLSDSAQQGVFLFVAEVPLLYESSLDKFYDGVIVVASDRALCQMRYVQDHSDDKEEFLKRSARLMSQNEKIQKAQWVIENNSDLEALKGSTEALYRQLIEKNHH